MSLQPPNLQDYIDRIAETFEANTTLFPDDKVGTNLVTKVIRNRPAIEQSAENGIIPYILVFDSGEPIKFLEKAGRDSRNVEGGSVYELSIYCVAITNTGITREDAQKSIHNITQAMRTALANNMRLSNPDGSEPLCRTHSRFEIPYLLRGDVPSTMIARNVVIRPQLYVSPRSV